MATHRPLLLLVVPLLLTFSGAVSASSSSSDPVPIANGDFEQDFVAVTVGGHDGQVGAGWTPFVVSGDPRFLAGQVQPPLDRWQVLHGPDGAYVAGVLQQLAGVRAGERLRAEAQVYVPQPSDGIARAIGLDPSGGTDPGAATVVWSSGDRQESWQTIAVTATMVATQTTVFVRAAQAEQAPPTYVYVDDVAVWRVGFEQRTYLPAVAITLPAEEEGWHYGVDGLITGAPSCASSGMRGLVRDESGQPRQDVRVKIWSTATSGQPAFVSSPTGSDGRWEIVLDSARPLAGRWYVAVVNQSLEAISPIVGKVAYADVPANPETVGIPTHADCVNGHQWLTINFRGRSEFPTYALASARFLSCLENHQDHNLRLWVITVDGQGIRDLPVRFQEAGGFVDQLLTGRDPFKPAGYIDYPIYRRQSWTTTVLAGPSDTSPAMSSETPPVIDACSGNTWGHYSYEIVFQRQP